MSENDQAPVSRPELSVSTPDRGHGQWLINSINDLTRRVGKLEATATNLEKQNDEIKGRIDKIDDSVRSLHTRVTFAAGAVFLGMVIFGWLFKGGLNYLTEGFTENLATGFVSAMEAYEQGREKAP